MKKMIYMIAFAAVLCWDLRQQHRPLLIMPNWWTE